VGDRVLVNCNCFGKKVYEEKIIKAIHNGQEGTFDFDRGGSCTYPHEHLTLISKGEPMSKYTELKQRIEAINQNTTVKEWDDLLGIFYHEYQKDMDNFKKQDSHGYFLYIPIHSESGGLTIWNRKKEEVANFQYSSQCEKGEAHKKALLWLLDHSDIKDEKAEKIEKLREEMKKSNEDFERRIKELEQ
jgi:hypothetical protein